MLFPAEGRGWAVTRVNDRLVGEGKKHTLDAIHQLLRASTRQVGSTDALVKENVPVKEHPFRRHVEANVAWGVARGVKHLEAQRAHFQFISIVQL